MRRLRCRFVLPLWRPAGGLPGWSPDNLAVPMPGGGLPSLSPVYPAFCLLSCPHPPSPRSQSALPGGKGENYSFLMQGASPLASPGLNRKRHWLTLPPLSPAGGVRSLSPTAPAFIAVFKIKAHIHMNGTTLNSQKARHSERRVESHWEEHPVTLP